ncbi:MAG: dihydrodipicolinate reductase C-terminal domain-containing protein [Planctomycetota bacterium]
MPTYAIAGATGRMGQRILALAEQATITLERGGDLPTADALIDFTLPDGFRYWLAKAVDAGMPFVSGTTGLTDEDQARLDRAAIHIPVLHATNTSIGVAVLNRLAAEACRLLPDADVAIVETHHIKKLDAPSGTAKTLAAATGRADVPTESLRLGDVVGDHTLHLALPGERLELTHRATSRDLFAHGAIRCAAWLIGKSAGRYAVDDVYA